MSTVAQLNLEGVEAWTAKHIAELLIASLHTGTEWLCYENLRTGTGYGHSCEQEIDLWMIDTYPSHDYERLSYEIKLSRSDFLRELKQPRKRALALLFSNLFYFAAPQGIIRPQDLPPEAGLVEVSDGRARV